MKRIYDLMPFYLVRSAVSECGFGEENATVEDLCHEFWNNGVFREQLLIASPRACLKNKSCTKHIFPRPFS